MDSHKPGGQIAVVFRILYVEAENIWTNRQLRSRAFGNYDGERKRQEVSGGLSGTDFTGDIEKERE